MRIPLYVARNIAGLGSQLHQPPYRNPSTVQDRCHSISTYVSGGSSVGMGYFRRLEWHVLRLPFSHPAAGPGGLRVSSFGLAGKHYELCHRGAFRVTGRGRSGEAYTIVEGRDDGAELITDSA